MASENCPHNYEVGLVVKLNPVEKETNQIVIAKLNCARVQDKPNLPLTLRNVDFHRGQALDNSSTVISGRAPTRMGRTVVPIPRLT